MKKETELKKNVLMSTIIEDLKQYRREHRLTIDRLAALLGVKPNAVYAWFSGRRGPSELNRYQIGKLLNSPRP